MSTPALPVVPSARRLLKATLLAIAVAAVLLVTVVLPAEYGIDPTGIGKRLGLDALAPPAQAPAPAETAASARQPPSAVTAPAVAAAPDAATTKLAADATAAFGVHPEQSFDAAPFAATAGAPHRDAMTVTLEPGKGVEVKSRLAAGQGLVFRWEASADVAVDMHGEKPDGDGTWTTYAAAAAQSEGAGTFVAPFAGTHGWYWQNRSDAPVTVAVEVFGFQPELYRP